jgi:hypothetical protein
MMKSAVFILVSAVLLTTGCASRGAPGSGAGMDRTRWQGDAQLYEILLTYPMTQAQQDALSAYAQEHMAAAVDNLAEAAEDVHAPASVRVNAIMALAQRRSGAYLPVFRALIDDEDVRVRATAVAAMREFVQTHPYEAGRLARVALDDSEPDVQAQALQIVGDDDLDLLRSYVPRAANDDLRDVARDLIRVAEERGAPLVRDSVTGALQRETFTGYTVTFMPRQGWAQWDAAYGAVTIARGSTVIATIDGVEAVARVLPVFFSADGRFAVYERDRTIVVRTLESGAERVLGPGIAPRVRPFTDEFVYLRQASPAEEAREQTRLRYDVVNAYFDDVAGQPRVLGTTIATATFDRHGNYSPVRWMRIEERVGNFYLRAERMDMVTLPDPFAPAGG